MLALCRKPRTHLRLYVQFVACRRNLANGAQIPKGVGNGQQRTLHTCCQTTVSQPSTSPTVVPRSDCGAVSVVAQSMKKQDSVDEKPIASAYQSNQTCRQWRPDRQFLTFFCFCSSFCFFQASANRKNRPIRRRTSS